MSWRELGQTWNDGDSVLSDDLNNTFIPAIGEINGHLDRDNFGYRILTDPKVVVNAVNRVWGGASDTPVTVHGRRSILDVAIDADEWITVRASFTCIGSVKIYPYLQVGDVIVEIHDWMDVTLPGVRSISWSGPVIAGVQTVSLGIGCGYGSFITVNSRSMTIIESRR